MDLWFQKAMNLAEEAAKKSQDIANEAAKKSQDIAKEAAKISQEIVLETAKKSKEFAVEVTKKADQIKIEAVKGADKIKSLADGIPSPIPVLSRGELQPSGEDLEKYGVTDDLREFVKGLTLDTFRDFPLDSNDDEQLTSDVPTVSNVRQDLTEWQAKHATLVLSSVKEISQFRYSLCPRHMKERKFWRIYFLLVKSHVHPYEMRAMEEAKLKQQEKKPEETESRRPTEVQTTNPSSLKKGPSTELDLDVFLLGDLGSSDEGPDDADEGFDDDFDKIVSNDASDSEDDAEKKKP
ncbi:uncharacterized protein LOC18433931 isoform X1 [Amborella trichopoda]|uniref:BSD domain-containing protein n=1 Tax=Amborella trichopoda TaxID=13333 RepID=W1PDQ0_AMBTC|nr:uncharacterized protein LOC18433931 isoform X1 [Amborella trichopoda]XP_011623239.1 uncharacterized protein LOC18433931 isoform X1 [Amborella trichopoda]XP_020522684.1 uncharacterized protein LOC18433931 isoform X1 [Amborella trichopoda]ERN05746.1 hypothetical protein AMTR_s00006p00249440 [Amborella trichopoda]|eukprot:XP_011623238.1 uncharacterized protein LOC18433931 isoform X1 [Amborella trichopoda]